MVNSVTKPGEHCKDICLKLLLLKIYKSIFNLSLNLWRTHGYHIRVSCKETAEIRHTWSVQSQMP